MGIKNNNENKFANNQVKSDKLEHEMTHGVDVSKFQYKPTNTLFSIWDFAGKFFLFFFKKFF